MNKRGLTKFGLVILGLVALAIFISSISYSTSLVDIKDRQYNVGESIKFDFTNQEYYLKITTPSTSFAKDGKNDKFSFKLNEKGKYTFSVNSNEISQKYDVFVGIDKPSNEVVKNISNNLANKNKFTEISLGSINKTELIKSETEKEVKIYPKNKANSFSVTNLHNLTVSTDVFVNVEEEKKIRVLWKEKNEYVDFQANKDEFGLIENISWNVSDAEVQTFEIIILVTKAEHLDENRTFISDIYDSVKLRDGIWSETISSGDYVRVYFEKKLTNKNDITIFPRIISGNPSVEVYELGSNSLLENFSILNNTAYNKVYLTKLQSEQDAFDLKVVGGAVEFDHIIDPTPKVLPSGRRNGMFVVSNSTSQSPNYLMWNGSNWSAISEALPVGGIPEWLTVRAGIVRDEYILISADNVDDINIQINFTNSSGQRCWGNGTACNVVWEVNATSTTADVQKADLAYSHKSGNALAVWSDNSRRPLFTVWNGSYWSRPRAINDTAVSDIGSLSLIGTNIETVQLASRTNNSDEIALLLTDSNDDSEVVIWNGTGFYCQSPRLSTSLGTTNVQKADLDYEDMSGDLFVASITTATQFNITTKAADTCTFVSNTLTVLNAVWMDVSAQPGTDNVMLVGSTGGATDDMNAQVWRGDAWGNTSAEDTSVYAAAAAPNQFFSAAWAGLKAGLVVYSDAANTAVDWFHFNTTSMAWQGTPATDFTPTPAFSTTGESNIKAYSFMDENKTIAFFKDANLTHKKIWAKIFDAETNTWADTESGQPLVWNASATNTMYPTFDFTWQKYITPPARAIAYPANTTYNINVSELNYTRNGAAFCWYSTDDGATNSSPSATCSNFTNVLSVQGTNTWILYANDSLGVWDSSNVTFFVDSIYPLIDFGISTEENNTYKSSSIININITYSDTNLINATIYLYNSSMHLVKNTTSFSSPNFTAYSNLPDGKYYFNATVYDVLSNVNITETREITLDTKLPVTKIDYPLNQTYNYVVNEINYTFVDANPSYCWYSTDNGNSNSSFVSCGENFTSPSSGQGSNNWILYMNDSAGNLNYSNVTFFVDSINPGIRFVPPTALNSTSRDQNFIYVEVELIEDNFANITYTLANNTQILNVTTYTNPTISINWTNLNSSNVRYFYNVSVYDILGNYNDTGTRVLNLTLGDIAPPDIFFNLPEFNHMFFNYSNINLNVTLNEEADRVSYSFNYGVLNYSMSNLSLFDYNASVSLADGFYQLTIFANDTTGNAGSRSRNFSIDTVYPLIDYGIGTESTGSYVARDWIYVNTSVVELNEFSINFTLFNDLGIVNSTTFVDQTREINWTGLLDGVYFYNVTLIDSAGNINYTQTRNITTDLTLPEVYLNVPYNNSYVNYTSNNLTVNSSDNFVLSNLTLFIYNSSNSLINQTIIFSQSSTTANGVLFNFPYDGNFTWYYSIYDKAGNQNISEPRNIIVDTSKPSLYYISGTENNNTAFERDWIYVNVSISDLNFENITYILFNSTDLINSTTFYSPIADINWTGLSSKNITYYYNVSGYDLAGNFNTTRTRIIKLMDITPPNLSLFSPQNESYDYNESIPLQFFPLDVNLDKCWFNLDNTVNSTISCDVNTTFSVSDASHTLYLYVNDSMNNVAKINVTFFANSSLILTPDYIVQRGVVVVNGVNNSSLPYKIDKTKSFILLNTRSTSSTGNILQVGANYTNSTNINFYNYAGSATVEWESVSGPDFNVQRGTAVHGTTDITLNITISPVNLSSSFIIIQDRLNSGTANQYLRGMWTGVFRNSTMIQLQRATTGTAGEVFWQVVDWTGAVVQNGTTALTGVSSFVNPTNNFSTDRTFVIASSRAVTSTSAISLFGNSRIINLTTIQLSRGGGASGTLTMAWFVVSHDSIRVSNTSALMGAVASLNSPVPALVNTSKSFRVTSFNSSGAITTYANAHVTSAISSSTNVRLDKGATAQTNVISIQTIEFIERSAPNVILVYPVNSTNFSTLSINSFNYTVKDGSLIDNCSLLGSWVSSSLGINETVSGPSVDIVNNFSTVNLADGYYIWNVRCYDVYGNLGYNLTNNSFAAFLSAVSPRGGNITQTSNNGTGNVTLAWDAADHAAFYNIYYSTNASDFVFLNQTNSTNYTDASFSGNKRRFYKVSAWNPTYENYSSELFVAQVYTLSKSANTRNWIGFIANTSLKNANETLYEINNITSITMWNATIQKSVTCNKFSCPSFPSCTPTNCNFNFNMDSGEGYEVNLNSSAPSQVNWSTVGKVFTPKNITLIKNSTSSGKNWISIYSTTRFVNAQTVLGNTSRADSITRWNSQTQASQGLIPSPFPTGPRYVGTNFPLSFEEAYEISVNQTVNFSQV